MDSLSRLNGHAPLQHRIRATYEDSFVDITGIEEQVEKHWQEQLATGQRLWDNPVLVYRDAAVTDEEIQLPLQKTRYAHFLYQQANPRLPEEYRVQTVSPVALLTTSDEKGILGIQASDILHGGRVLAFGGALDLKDIHDGKPDIEGNLARKLREEAGVDLESVEHDAVGLYTTPTYGCLGILYEVRLPMTGDEATAAFAEHNERLAAAGERPEIDRPYLFDLREPPQDERMLPYVPGHIELVRRQII